MNVGNRQKKWFDYCMNSTVLDRNGMAELRMTKDVDGYCNSMYVIVIYKCGGGIEETLSENIYSKEELLKIWQEWKNNL